VAYCYTDHYIFDVAIDGHLALLAAAADGLLIADISNPAQPAEVVSWDTPGYAYAVAAAGATIYVADGWEGLRTVEISNPNMPTEVASYDTDGWAIDTVAVDTKAYAADVVTGLHIIDGSGGACLSSLPSLSGNQKGLWQVRSLALNRGFLYIASPSTGLQIMDVSDPQKPTQVGLYSPLNFAGSVAVSGSYAYVAGTYAHSHPLRVVDLSDVAHPGEVSGDEVTENATGVEVQNNCAYALDFGVNQGLGIADISTPSEPLALSFLALNGPPTSTFLRESTAYVTTEFSFEIADISNPKSPAKIGVLDFTGGFGRQAGADVASDVAISGSMAYITLSKLGLAVVDISNPAKPTLLTTYRAPEMVKPNSIIVAGDFAYIGDRNVKVVDISNPKEPALAAVCEIEGATQHMVLTEGILYVASGSAGLQAVDVTDPSHPRVVASCYLPGQTLDVAVDNKYVYAACSEGGLYIVERMANRGIAGKKTSAYQNSAAETAHSYALLNNMLSATTTFNPVYPSTPAFRNGFTSCDLSVLEAVNQRWVQDRHNLYSVRQTDAYSGTSSGKGQIWTVNSAADSGAGTLRWALENAGGGDTITFDSKVFPPQAPVSIRLVSALPYLNQGNLTIDASNAGVILDGSGTPKNTHGLLITSDHNVVKGLQIAGFPGAGIGIAGGSYNTIGGDRTHGGGPAGEGNVISGNKGAGIGISDSIDSVCTDIGVTSSQITPSVGNRVIGNYIGTDAAGAKSGGDQGTGVWICGKGVSRNIIGGPTPAERNVISGNVRAGVSVMGSGSSRNVIEGNFIGTDGSGQKALGNKGWGISIEGGSSTTVVRNVISGNDGVGVIITDPGASGNDVMGNLIGTDVTGTIALGNGQGGIHVNESFNRVGGTTPEERNIISGNKEDGVKIGWMSTTGVVVIGNYVGTDITGTKPLGNSSPGISLQEGTYHTFIGGSTTVERNVISANAGCGIEFGGHGVRYNFAIGNYIGTDSSGTKGLPNDSGIFIAGAEHNFVQANLIAYNKGGIAIKLGGNNHIHHNNLLNNGKSSDGGNNNMWDDGKEGNFWSDYRGGDSNSDGVGDTPYPIPPNGVDNYPLMKPYQMIAR
jgi:parallel beta-helix repeat protein